jgi:hypothetical protein
LGSVQNPILLSRQEAAEPQKRAPSLAYWLRLVTPNVAEIERRRPDSGVSWRAPTRNYSARNRRNLSGFNDIEPGFGVSPDTLCRRDPFHLAFPDHGPRTPLLLPTARAAAQFAWVRLSQLPCTTSAATPDHRRRLAMAGPSQRSAMHQHRPEILVLPARAGELSLKPLAAPLP